MYESTFRLTMLSQKESSCMKSLKRSKRNCLSKYSSAPTAPASPVRVLSLEDLGPDCIEQITLFLDTKSALGQSPVESNAMKIEN